MTVCLVLVSHPSTGNLRVAAFPSDEALDSQGAAAAATLNLRPVDQAWCAPSVAARQTAVALGITASTDLAIRDCDFGRWSGRALSEVYHDEPDAVAAWINDPTSAPHGGESLTDLLDRIGAWLDRQRNQTGNIVAVTHPSVIRAALVHAIDATAASFWRIDIPPLCQAQLNAHSGRWNLRSLAQPTVGC
jgi:broad specificity phosphatase PhoE